MINGNFKVHVEPVKYVVNEQKKTVVCVAQVSMDTPWINDELYVQFYEEPYQKTMVGVAKCSPNDEFDVELGKRIAYAKVENKAYNEAARYVLERYIGLSVIGAKCLDFVEKAQFCVEHNTDYIQALTDKNHPSYGVLLEKRKNKEAKNNQ